MTVGKDACKLCDNIPARELSQAGQQTPEAALLVKIKKDHSGGRKVPRKSGQALVQIEAMAFA